MALKLIDITKKYDNKQIFSSFSYAFKERGVYAILGDSGVGKTTLLRIISGLDTSYSGDVIDGGLKNVSMCFQEYRLFPNLSALQNITETLFDNPTADDTYKAIKLLQRLNFSENDLNLFPHELSGGMKQRVALARAILKDAPILLLDEPTKELDLDIVSKIHSLIMEEGLRRLVIFVSHRKDDIEKIECEKISIS